MIEFNEIQSEAAMHQAIGRRFLSLIEGELEFAAAKKGSKGKGGANKKDCKKGISCGSSCIAKSKACVKEMSASQKAKYNALVKKVKAGGGGGGDSTESSMLKSANDQIKAETPVTKESLEAEIKSLEKQLSDKRNQLDLITGRKPEPKTAKEVKPAKAAKVIAKNSAPIKDYAEFEKAVMPEFSKLNSENNYGGLVPIWHLRQELGSRMSRSEFNDWMMDAQRNRKLYLQSGEAIGASDKQKRDSINSEIRGLLFYASIPED